MSGGAIRQVILSLSVSLPLSVSLTLYEKRRGGREEEGKEGRLTTRNCRHQDPAITLLAKNNQIVKPVKHIFKVIYLYKF